MLSGYYYKLQNYWTNPLWNLPRWTLPSVEPGISNLIPLPSLTPLSTGTYTAPVSGNIPPSWVFTPASPSTGSLLRQFVEVLVNSNAYIIPNIRSMQNSRSFFWDTSDITFGWLVENIEPVSKVEIVLTDGSTIVATEALGIWDLFNSFGWRWLQSDTQVLITGLDYQLQTSTIVGSGWQFITSATGWTSGSIVYLQHPNSSNLIPIHPSEIRNDGFLKFNYPKTLTLGTRYDQAALDLSYVNIKINGVSKQAKRVNISNSLDEAGLYCNLPRNIGEPNSQYSSYLFLANWFTDQTIQGINSYLSAYFRQGSTMVVSPTSTGFTLPSNATGFSILNVNPFAFITENLVPDIDSTSFYRSTFNSPDFGCSFLNTLEVPFSQLGSGLVSVNSALDNKTDRLTINWKISYWNQIGNQVIFTNNLPQNIPNLKVFISQNVSVEKSDNNTLIDVYASKSPSLIWQATDLGKEDFTGLASF